MYVYILFLLYHLTRSGRSKRVNQRAELVNAQLSRGALPPLRYSASARVRPSVRCAAVATTRAAATCTAVALSVARKPPT